MYVGFLKNFYIIIVSEFYSFWYFERRNLIYIYDREYMMGIKECFRLYFPLILFIVRHKDLNGEIVNLKNC